MRRVRPRAQGTQPRMLPESISTCSGGVGVTVESCHMSHTGVEERGRTLEAVRLLLLPQGTTAAPAKATRRRMLTFGGKGRTAPAYRRRENRLVPTAARVRGGGGDEACADWCDGWGAGEQWGGEGGEGGTCCGEERWRVAYDVAVGRREGNGAGLGEEEDGAAQLLQARALVVLDAKCQ